MDLQSAPGPLHHAVGSRIISQAEFDADRDFLLHDVGTGDGIVQNGGPATRNKLRTPPL